MSAIESSTTSSLSNTSDTGSFDKSNVSDSYTSDSNDVDTNNVMANSQLTSIDTGSETNSQTQKRGESCALSAQQITSQDRPVSEDSPKPPKRMKKSVKFAQETKVDDGKKVAIKEEHGVFLGPLLGRMVVSNDNSSASSGENGETGKGFGNEKVSFGGLAGSDNLNSKVADSGSGVDARVDSSVDYDNLVIRMGLLKCGQRYRVAVPVPDFWKNQQCVYESKDQQETVKNNVIDDATALDRHEEHEEEKKPSPTQQPTQIPQNSSDSISEPEYNIDVRIIENSLDDDLTGEIETEWIGANDDSTSHSIDNSDMSNCADPSSSSSSAQSRCQHYVNITLSARRRGLYRGRFVLELTKNPISMQAETSSDVTQKSPIVSTIKRCVMSLQVDATIMGKDMGTPKLRNGVICLGKMVGYDSDEETEWQGFD